jgi:hypothetical protein
MKRLLERCRDSGFTGRLLSSLLIISVPRTVWPIYVSVERAWNDSAWPPQYAWVASIAYFGFWVWLEVLLTREGKQYSGMVLDSVCGGSLVTVAIVLLRSPTHQILSGIGFGAAGWVVLLSAVIFVFGRAARGDRHYSGPPAGGLPDRK